MIHYHKLPKWAPMGGLTIGQHIFLKHLGEEGYAHILRHEEVHAAQFRKLGFWKFLRRYYLSREGRALIEAEAYAESVRCGMDIRDCAKLLSGKLYLWPCTYSEALHLIQIFRNGRSILS